MAFIGAIVVGALTVAAIALLVAAGVWVWGCLIDAEWFQAVCGWTVIIGFCGIGAFGVVAALSVIGAVVIHLAKPVLS